MRSFSCGLWPAGVDTRYLACTSSVKDRRCPSAVLSRRAQEYFGPKPSPCVLGVLSTGFRRTARPERSGRLRFGHMTDFVTYSPERVIADLRSLDHRTGGAEGSRRLAWTTEWLEARAMFRESLATLPVQIDEDAAGNLWAVLPGQRPDMLVVGSHLDSVPKGGWLDGALGVTAGVELLRALAAEGTPPVTVAVVDWADEEGARFSRSLFGSAACVGTLNVDVLRGLVDKEGARLPEVLAEHGVDIDNLDGARIRMANVKAYVEVHIEQGPILESMGKGICTVTGTKGIERERLIFRGQAAHAGTMPMDMRRDSFRAASRFALAIAEIGERHDGVTTVGHVQCWPGVVTAVAGETRIAMDMRHIDAGALRTMFDEAHEAAEAAAASESCTVEWEHIFRIPPMPFHPLLLDAARQSVREVEGHDVELPSGALHDASEMAREVPTVMIFSSSTNGLSHTKEEDTPVEHLEMAVDAFHRTCRRAIELIVDGQLART
jgi:beta-ureidopropionase / N-carbamoyl-L-amino-acid hydrolase